MKRLTYSVAAAALVSALLGGAPLWGQQPIGTTAPAAKSTPTAAAKVNINTANEAGLMSLKGIGEKKAKAIIAYRDKNGPFKTVDDLTKVKGIKEKQLAQLRDQITVE